MVRDLKIGDVLYLKPISYFKGRVPKYFSEYFCHEPEIPFKVENIRPANSNSISSPNTEYEVYISRLELHTTNFWYEHGGRGSNWDKYFLTEEDYFSYIRKQKINKILK